jgi:hypothetical protein
MDPVTIYLIILVLLLIQLKHFVIDYVVQSDSAQLRKSNYFDHWSIVHSVTHGAATAVSFIIVFPSEPILAAAMGFLDVFLHHHIDYAKTRIEDTKNPIISVRYLWGVDQLFHQLSYLGLLLIALQFLH